MRERITVYKLRKTRGYYLYSQTSLLKEIQWLKDILSVWKYLQIIMSEAHVKEVEQQFFTLSKHMKVEVSGTGQIVFVCVPEKDFMSPIKVSLSGKAWNSLMKDARANINQLLEDGGENIWEYHPNSKYVRVCNNGYGAQVSLLTINRKGFEMRQYSVYMNEQEWCALDRYAEEITDLLHKMHRQNIGVQVNQQMVVYKWKFPPNLKEGTAPPVCKDIYYTEEHAREKGMEIGASSTEPLGAVQVINELMTPVDPMKFYLMVYLTLLYRCCDKLNILNCEGCKDDEAGHHPSHKHFNGCKAYGRLVVEDYLPIAKKCLKKIYVDKVFHQCWKYLKLGSVDVDKLWKHLFIIVPEDDKTEYLKCKVTHIQKHNRDIAECLFVQNYIIDSELMKWVNVQDCKSDSSDSSQGSVKKLKLYIDSDDDEIIFSP